MLMAVFAGVAAFSLHQATQAESARPPARGNDAGQPAQAVPGSVELVAGLNIVNYSGAANAPEAALANCLASVSAVFYWNTSAQAYSWWFNNAPPGVNSLAAVNPGSILWLQAAAACDWQQPSDTSPPVGPGTDVRFVFVSGITSNFNCGQRDAKSEQWWSLWDYLKSNLPDLTLDDEDLFFFSYADDYNCPGAIPDTRAFYEPGDTCDSIDAAGDTFSGHRSAGASTSDGGYAQVFHNWMRRLTQSYPEARFNIIGHSMGGLVISAWAAGSASDDADLAQILARVNALIPMNSPIQGYAFILPQVAAFFAPCTATDPAFADMLRSSETVMGVGSPVAPGDCAPAAAYDQQRLVVQGASGRSDVSSAASVYTVSNASDLIVNLQVSCLWGAADFPVNDACPNITFHHGCAFFNTKVRQQIVAWSR